MRKLNIALSVSIIVLILSAMLCISRFTSCGNKDVIYTGVNKQEKVEYGAESDFLRCHVNKVDYTQNYMEIQTFDFKTVSINFLDDSLKLNRKFNFKEGDWVNIIAVKSLKRNGAKFYFLDNSSIINSLVEENDGAKITEDPKEEIDVIKETNDILEKLPSNKEEGNYNYGE